MQKGYNSYCFLLFGAQQVGHTGESKLPHVMTFAHVNSCLFSCEIWLKESTVVAESADIGLTVK